MILSVLENKVLSTILMIVIVALIIVASYFLFKKIIFEMQKERFAKQNKIDGVISKIEMESLLATYISQLGTNNSFGLLYVDLDKFNNFRNAFNEKEVAVILKEVVNRIKNILPSDVKISRFQGDEFVILMNHKYKRSDVEQYGQKLLEQFREPIKLYEHTVLDQTASIAVAYYPNHGVKVDALIKSLKLAMYKVKKAGGNNLNVYSKSIEEETENADYYFQIKDAMEKDQFTLYYQPIVSIETKEVFAIESLIRWNHPTLGVLTPNKFMPIMEQSGDIYWVGLWGLEKLIQNYHVWVNNGVNVFPTINISSKQLMYDEIAVDFQKICKRTKISPNKIILEIEEFALFDKNNTIYNNLLKLKSIGFQIAIDGYGIDFNALEQIEKLDIDAIKFKYSILTGKKTYAAEKMLETILEFVEKKNKTLIVQDLEDDEMIEKVSKYNAKYGQGYYFSRVLSADDLSEYLKAEK